MTNYKKWNLFILIMSAILIVFGLVFPEYILQLVATAILYGLFTVSVDFSYGYAGILNLGSAVYFGIGAYVTAFGLKANMFPILPVVIGIGLAVIVAVVIGFVGFRVKASQIHFGLIGLAVTIAFQQIAITFYDITGGSNGITNVKRPEIFSSVFVYYIFVVLVSMFIFYLLWRLTNSNFGKAMKALKHDEIKIEAMGYSPMKVKITVTAITAAVSALAGSLFVGVSGIADPNLFGVTLSMSVLIWGVLGGTGTLIGPFIVATVLKLTETTLSTSFQETYLLIIGLLFIVVVVVAPSGLFGLGKQLFSKIKIKNSRKVDSYV